MVPVGQRMNNEIYDQLRSGLNIAFKAIHVEKTYDVMSTLGNIFNSQRMTAGFIIKMIPVFDLGTSYHHRLGQKDRAQGITLSA